MAGGKPVEDSYTSEVVALLKNKGLNATFKKSYNTVLGRQEPDITIELSEGILLVEAKVPPQGLPQALEQISEYQKGIGTTEKIIGVFAVVYKEKQHDIFYSSGKVLDSQKLKKLNDIADYIFIKSNEKPTIIQPVSTQKIINILDENVTLISHQLSNMVKEDIEAIFGGRNFFSTVLDYKEEKAVSPEVLRHAAAYLLINQILFYQILSNETNNYPKIDVKEIKFGKDLQEKFFDRVLVNDYAAIFGFNIAGKIKDSQSIAALKTTISAIQVFAPQLLSSHELLGKIFHNLIPLELRKVVAAYFTNSEAGELLANLAIENKDDKVIDPACGSGTLLVATYNRKKSLHEKFQDKDHVRFLEHEIYGVDILPFSAHLAAVSLALQAPLSYTNIVNIAIHDSTELAPGIAISPAREVISESYKVAKLTEFVGGALLKRPRIKKGVIDLLEQQRAIELPKFDVVIMNPPFTRFQRIPPEYKKKLAERFSAPRYRDIIHGQMGLHGYFLLLADKMLKPGGRIAAVLPITTLSLKGFYDLLDLLTRNYQIEHIIVSSGRSAFSENTSLREILFVAKKTAPIPESTIKFTYIHASPEDLTIEKARDIGKRIKNIKTEDELNEDFYLRQINQNNFLNEVRSLYKAVNLHSPDLVKIDKLFEKYFLRNKNYTTIGAVENSEKWKIHESTKGVEKRGYYYLSIISTEEKALKEHDVWVLEDETENILKVKQRFSGQIFKIPKSCVVRQFRRFPGQSKIILESPFDYIIVRKFDNMDQFLMSYPATDKQIIENIKKNIRGGDWEKYVIKNSSNTFGFYRGNLSAPGTKVFSVKTDTSTFTGPGSSWSMHLPERHLKLFTLWFNSSMVIYDILRDRNETEGGFIGIDKYLLTEIPYPKLETVDQKELSKLFDDVKKLEFPSLLEQVQRHFEGRVKIDTFFLKHAGMKDDDVKRTLDNLYETLAKELLKLKGVMGK